MSSNLRICLFLLIITVFRLAYLQTISDDNDEITTETSTNLVFLTDKNDVQTTTTESSSEQSQTTVISIPHSVTKPSSVIITSSTSSSSTLSSTNSSLIIEPENVETTTIKIQNKKDNQISTTPLPNEEEKDETIEVTTESSEEHENTKNDESNDEEENNEDEEDEDEKESHDNDNTTTESGSGTNENEEEDEDEEEEDEEDDDLGERFVERIRALHEKSKEMTRPKPPVTFNETLDRISQAISVVQGNFLPSQKMMTRFATLITDLNVDLSRECLGSMWAIANGLRDQEPWAYRFLDANGKLRDFTTMTGRMWSYGDYRECLSHKSRKLKEGFVIHGKYCTLEIKVPLPKTYESSSNIVNIKHPFLKKIQRFLRAYDAEALINTDKFSQLLRVFNGTIFRMGLCLPELCSTEEVERIVANLTEPIFKLPVYLNRKCATPTQKERVNSSQAISIFILGMFIILTILCTAIEAYNLSYERKAKRADEKLGSLMFQQVSAEHISKPYAFSILNGFRRLFSSQKAPLSSLQSLKFFLIIYVHFYNYYNFRATYGLVTLKRILTTYPLENLRSDSYALLRTTLPFDLLSLILGFELAFEWRKLKNAQSWHPFTVLRDLWILLSVTFLGSVVCINVLNIIGKGPAWDLGMFWLAQPCENSYSVLMNIFHISNFNRFFNIFKPSDPLSFAPICNPASWFISVLFQLTIIVAIILGLFSMFKKQKSRIAFFTFLMCLSIFLSWSPYLFSKLKPEMHHTEMKNIDEVMDSFTLYRTGTQTFMIYLISGIAAGLALAEHSSVLQRGIENFLLFGVFVIFQLCIALNNRLWNLSNDSSSKVSIISSLFYYGPIRAFNSVGIAFFLFCFTSKRIPKLKSMFECRPLLIVGRLSHSYLLVQSMVIFYRIFSSVEQTSMDFSTMSQTFLIDVISTTILSGLFFCFFESPTITILENFAENNKIYKQKKESKDNNNKSKYFDGKSNISDTFEDNFQSETPKIVIEDWGNSNEMQRVLKVNGEDYPTINNKHNNEITQNNKTSNNSVDYVQNNRQTSENFQKNENNFQNCDFETSRL